jgi:hypothetical protein
MVIKIKYFFLKKRFLICSWLLWKHTDNMDPVDLTSKVVIPKALIKAVSQNSRWRWKEMVSSTTLGYLPQYIVVVLKVQSATQTHPGVTH